MEVLLKSLPILQKYMRHLTALVQELPVLYMLKEFMETEILHTDTNTFMGAPQITYKICFIKVTCLLAWNSIKKVRAQQVAFNSTAIYHNH